MVSVITIENKIVPLKKILKKFDKSVEVMTNSNSTFGTLVTKILVTIKTELFLRKILSEEIQTKLFTTNVELFPFPRDSVATLLTNSLRKLLLSDLTMNGSLPPKADMETNNYKNWLNTKFVMFVVLKVTVWLPKNLKETLAET